MLIIINMINNYAYIDDDINVYKFNFTIIIQK